VLGYVLHDIIGIGNVHVHTELKGFFFAWMERQGSLFKL
jgi:hypothetical protein